MKSHPFDSGEAGSSTPPCDLVPRPCSSAFLPSFTLSIVELTENLLTYIRPAPSGPLTPQEYRPRHRNQKPWTTATKQQLRSPRIMA